MALWLAGNRLKGKGKKKIGDHYTLTLDRISAFWEVLS